MNALRMTVILIFAFVLIACASRQYPTAETTSIDSQQQILVVQHWDAVAARVAQRLANALSTSREAGEPLVLYLQKPRSPSAFENAFHDLLITRLLGEGFGVSEDAKVGLPVNYRVQVVTHRDPSQERPDSEILVTTSVMSGDRYLTRMSDIYYVLDTELDNYVVFRSTPDRLMEVVGQ